MWFLAKMVFRIVCGNGEHTAQFDEQLRLIEANSREEAIDKAKQMGLKEQDAFYNQRLKLVRWEFINVSELHAIGALADGIELYSKIEEKDNAENYMVAVHRKAEQLSSIEPASWV